MTECQIIDIIELLNRERRVRFISIGLKDEKHITITYGHSNRCFENNTQTNIARYICLKNKTLLILL